MDIESLNFNMLQNKTEKNSATNSFLREQIRLPQEEWSSEFRKLVDEKAEESKIFLARRKRIRNGEEAEEIKFPKEEYKQTFNRYLEELGLCEEELCGKRIMDLGFGEGEFVKHLVATGIAPEAYGIDINQHEDVTEEEFDGHFFKQSSEENLPVQDLDYIVAIRSVSHNCEGKDGYVMNIKNVLEKSLFALKEGGEMRIYPIDECAKRNLNQKYAREEQKELDTLLPALSEEYGLKYEFEPRNIFVDPDSKDVTLQSVLILRKQSRK